MEIGVRFYLRFIRLHNPSIPDRQDLKRSKGNSTGLKKKQLSVIFQIHFTSNSKGILPKD